VHIEPCWGCCRGIDAQVLVGGVQTAAVSRLPHHLQYSGGGLSGLFNCVVGTLVVDVLVVHGVGLTLVGHVGLGTFCFAWFILVIASVVASSISLRCW
jgi:hypothetical protein